ncbi:MAG: hypothetical protein GTN37_04160 [Candidatus Aenigmarchaeota archaeon]|nr:hypothetical protein [Candidatus Aenigmarchaeota archaeon]NIS73590.1 hypothetical protein [Candidatus Aenigmarchaeota archaeon]
MTYFEEKLEKIKSMHTSNFIFWVFGKFLLGLGIGILLPVYFFNYGWGIAGWLIIAFAIILQIPAFITTFYKKKEGFKHKPRAME